MTERRFRRDVDSLAAVFAFVQEFFAANGLPEHTSFDLEVIAEELFTNCVKYGGDSSDVAIGLSWSAPELTLRICDQGAPPFDLTLAPPVDTAVPIEQRHAGGLGLHLVRQMADRIQWERLDGANRVTVVKRLEV